MFNPSLVRRILDVKMATMVRLRFWNKREQEWKRKGFKYEEEYATFSKIFLVSDMEKLNRMMRNQMARGMM